MDILAAIDEEIKRLQQVRRLLVNEKSSTHPSRATKPRKRRKMSAKARKRIADAQRRRWAKQKSK